VAGVARWGSERWGRRRALDSMVLNDAVATQGHGHPARRVLASASRSLPAREFGIYESDGAPDEKESRPKHEPPGYQACMMRGEMWPRRQETFPRPDASPPRCAQLMGLALRGCLVLVLGATAERRNLLFRSVLGLPWIRTLGLPRLSR
jgi:hypothetical protein